MHDENDCPPNRNPAVEKTVSILLAIERNAAGLALGKVCEVTGITRSTAYRILNSLVAHDILRQLENSNYVLGSRLLRLAERVTAEAVGAKVTVAAQPVIDGIARSLGETAKISVYDRGTIMVVAISLGRKARALQAQLGEHLPLHAGAGSKMLLAYLPQSELERILTTRLPQFTKKTLSQPEQLLLELDTIRSQGWSHDPGEFDLSVRAYAAPIRNRDGIVVAALSLPYFADIGPEGEAQILDAVISAVREIETAL